MKTVKKSVIKVSQSILMSLLLSVGFLQGAHAQSSSVTDVLDGTAEISGDPQVLVKAARESWKKACEDWKKEVKDLNKDNEVLILNCNSPVCVQEGPHQICRSKATYKVRLKLQN